MSSSVSSPEAGERHRALGLTDHEYELILSSLGREPVEVELAMLSLMWSEHCAYKHSRKLLRRLTTEGPHVLLGPGENAGAVDVGDGLAVAFKVESHNHPSAVEPFQGAATGVGGILRDIFAVGARPVAVLDSLRFGELSSERSRYLLEHHREMVTSLRAGILSGRVTGGYYWTSRFQPTYGPCGCAGGHLIAGTWDVAAQGRDADTASAPANRECFSPSRFPCCCARSCWRRRSASLSALPSTCRPSSLAPAGSPR